MGTPAITKFVDEDGEVVCAFYTQCDGNPTYHGKGLKEFLSPFVVTNGLFTSDKYPTANGAGCLAAQAVKHFKDGPGHTYMVSPPTEWEDDYTYTVFVTPNAPIRLTVHKGMTVLYIGDIKNYVPKD